MELSTERTRGVAPGNDAAVPGWEKSIWGPDATCARATAVAGSADANIRQLQSHDGRAHGDVRSIAACSSGLEPLFAVAFMRTRGV